MFLTWLTSSVTSGRTVRFGRLSCSSTPPKLFVQRYCPFVRHSTFHDAGLQQPRALESLGLVVQTATLILPTAWSACQESRFEQLEFRTCSD